MSQSTITRKSVAFRTALVSDSELFGLIRCAGVELSHKESADSGHRQAGLECYFRHASFDKHRAARVRVQ